MLQSIILAFSLKVDINFFIQWRVEGCVNIGTAEKVCSPCPKMMVTTYRWPS